MTEGVRARRSDRKKDIKPTIPISLKETIYRLSYITNTPVKDIGVRICELGVCSDKVIEYLSAHFRREVWVNKTLYRGDLNNPSIKQVQFEEANKERITLRFSQSIYEHMISPLAYALDITPSAATAYLLYVSMKDVELVNQIVYSHITQTLDPGRTKELKQVIKFINANSPFEEKISFVDVLSYIYSEMKIGKNNVKESINRWIDMYK